MSDIVTWHSRPQLDRIVFITGLPGVGNVGKIAADFLATKLEAETFLTLMSDELPPQVVVGEGCEAVPAEHELCWCRVGDRDVVFLLGEYQGATPQGQYLLSKRIFDIIVRYDPELVITLGGYGTGEVVTDPRVLGVVSDQSLKEGLEKYGIGFYEGEPAGGIVGAAAMFIALAQAYGIDAVSIIGETSGAILDHKSARCVVRAVLGILGTEMDLSDFDESVQMIDQLNDEVQSLAASRNDLSYIG